MNCAVVFPGQGSQTVGMGQELGSLVYEQLTFADNLLGSKLATLVAEGPQERLNLTINAQPAMFVLNYAYWQQLVAAKVKPLFLAGHSLGELSAYLAAGVFDFAAGLNIVQKRAQLMQKAGEKNPGVMLAVLGLTDAEVKEIANNYGWEIANYNCPGQVVLSLKKAEQEKAAATFSQAGARRVVPLAVSGAFHSSMMKEAAEEFINFLQTVNFHKPHTPVISNVTAKPVTSGEEAKKLLSQQITASVRWTETILYFKSQGVDCIIEAGPGRVLSGLIKRIDNMLTLKHASEFI